MNFGFGNFEITPIVDQLFYLDGGTMFGVVPKKLWSRLLPVDDQNLIPMACNLYLVKAVDKNYLVDCGLGVDLSEVEQKIYGASNKSALEENLLAMNMGVGDIDVVLLTHLHTDHAGGSVRFEKDKFVPRFPNATYYVQEREYKDAIDPDERSRAAYSKDRLQALADSGQLEFIDGDTEIAPGIKAVLTGGHTAGHQGYEFTSGGETVAAYCDIIPMTGHVRIPYVASVDLFPLDTLRFKRKLLKRLVAEKLVVAFGHDHEVTLARLEEENHKIIVKPLEEITAAK